jgi:hypothetical protein
MRLAAGPSPAVRLAQIPRPLRATEATFSHVEWPKNEPESAACAVDRIVGRARNER